jgi:hypothetical protein
MGLSINLFKKSWDSLLAEVPGKGARDIGEHKGSVVNQGFGKEGGAGMVHIDSGAWDGAVSEDKNSIDKVDMFLDLSSNIRLMELILLNIASGGESRCAKDANLWKRLGIHHIQKHWDYAALACKFVKAEGARLTLIAGTALLLCSRTSK